MTRHVFRRALRCGAASACVAGLPTIVSAQSAPEALPPIVVQQQAAPRKPRPPIPVRRPERLPLAASTLPSPTVPADGPIIASGQAAPAQMASQITVSGQELNARPVARPGELLEAAPGLIVTQHSGEGKANQYFLRGYNLDHGTDLAISVDDVPVNMRTHAHGQGYADLNWLMPETVAALDVRKGPYFADVGDFASAGDLRIGLVDRLAHNVASLTVGSFGYRRLFAMGAVPLGDGTLLAAGEAGRYDGPWTNPDDVKKLNALLRYSQGTAQDGFTVTGMAYANRWTSTDQVPQRALTAGLLPRFGTEDPSDGGNTDRFAVSARMASTDDAGSWKANLYAVRSTLDLYNNFTYHLSDPVNGDQFHQRDDRLMLGANLARSLDGSLAGRPMQTTIGLQSRYDDIDLQLSNTVRRSLLTPVRSDRVGEGSASLYAQSTVGWTDWLRTTLGWRGDAYTAQVESLLNSANSGTARAAIGSPKFTMVIGPFKATELFLGAGMGMHSNDARGATATVDPADPSASVSSSPLLVRTKGAEIGVRSRFIPGLDTSLSLFVLQQASEIVFNGDAGDTSASRPSRRYGIEWTAKYKPQSWISVDAALALTHARFLGDDAEQAALYAALAGTPEAQIGNAPGNSIPNAPATVASAGLTLGEATGWFGSLRWRYLGPTALTEDNSFRSPAVSLVNARLGWRDPRGWRIQLDVLNLLDADTNQITYAYGSLLKTDGLFARCFPTPSVPAAVCQTGVMDYVLHPVEPRSFRLTLAGTF